jgi:hypothetical protein
MPLQTSGTGRATLTQARPAPAASTAVRRRASWAWQRETLLRGEALASADPRTISKALMLRIALGHHPANAEQPLCARLSRFPLNFGGGRCDRQAAITGSS